MTAIPAAYLSIVNPLIGVARGIVEGGDSLQPFAFVGNLTTKETIPLLLSTGSDQAKDHSADLVRKVAQGIEADFVLVIMDAWGLPPNKAARFEEIIERYGSIGASPYRIDVVSFALETRYGIWVAQVPVQPKGSSKRKRTFGTPQFQHYTEARGRFGALLPIKDPTGEPPAVLH